MYPVDYQETFIKNSRGTSLFTCSWIPHAPIKALVFLFHGYGMDCSGYMKVCGLKLGGAGYAVFAMDYEGHGRSKGPRCFINNFDDVVDDCEDHFKSICEEKAYRHKGRFFYGESMGAAVAVLVHRKDPSFWNGGVLVAPMCKISKNLLLPKAVMNIMCKVEDVVPNWKICPVKNLIQQGFKDPFKREEVKSNKLVHGGKFRLRTGGVLYRTALYLAETLHEITFPFLVLHGGKDKLVDPEVSRTLYHLAGSTDKSIKIYPEMWHSLTAGEPDQNVNRVISDVIAWLDERAPTAMPLAAGHHDYDAIDTLWGKLRATSNCWRWVDDVDDLATSSSDNSNCTSGVGRRGAN